VAVSRGDCEAVYETDVCEEIRFIRYKGTQSGIIKAVNDICPIATVVPLSSKHTTLRGGPFLQELSDLMIANNSDL
jgi:hypothetical protein